MMPMHSLQNYPASALVLLDCGVWNVTQCASVRHFHEDIYTYRYSAQFLGVGGCLSGKSGSKFCSHSVVIASSCTINIRQALRYSQTGHRTTNAFPAGACLTRVAEQDRMFYIYISIPYYSSFYLSAFSSQLL